MALQAVLFLETFDTQIFALLSSMQSQNRDNLKTGINMYIVFIFYSFISEDKLGISFKKSKCISLPRSLNGDLDGT